MKILSVVGTRPNFMKLSALAEQFKRLDIENFIVHTGQHYDKELSQLFFDELGLPKPDINLGVGSGSYGEQIGDIIIKLERVLAAQKPDLVIVVGDVNSTLAAALIAKQSGIKVVHIESGLRSFDLSMPEEINRMLTDKISDFLFTTEKIGNKNLIKEGIQEDKIFFVGNTMIDTLLAHKNKSENSKILEKFHLKRKNYCILTLHRPSNVDNKEKFDNIISILEKIQEKIKIVFPVHPRTKSNIEYFNLNIKIKKLENIIICEPLGYLDFIKLMSNAKFVLTDSGGIQEETTVLGVPCITLRENTERPVTVEQGTNLLVSTDKNKIIEAINQILDNQIKLNYNIPELWDGKAAERIAQILLSRL